MGMSMHVYAVKPADDNYKRKRDAYRACEAAGIPVPKELVEFFDGDEPDEDGTAVNIDRQHPSCQPWENDGADGFSVDITKLPEGTRFVRFYCSW